MSVSTPSAWALLGALVLTMTFSHTARALEEKGPAKSGSKTEMSVTQSSFGKLPSGEEITLFTCRNANGLVMKGINYGGIITSVETPDRTGKSQNITLGFDNLEGYLGKHPYFGSTVGRYCNRIAKGKFRLDGKEYTLATNNGENHLHGGLKGFDKVVWKAEQIKTNDAVGVKFTYTSKDGEEGFPGTLQVTAIYTLTNADELKVELSATTDKPTVLNLTNHNYWNLGGAGSGNVLEHEIMIAADKYVAPNSALIPTGELAPVKGTPLDFTQATKVGAHLKEIKADPVGYDHCYVLRNQDPSKLVLAARVKEPKSGRVMEISTTQPGIQFYTGNFLDGSKDNGGYKQHEAFCLETQHYPDSPNQPTFPTTALRPGETFKHTTVHKFTVAK